MTRRALSAAEKQRRHRQRVRAGKRCVKVEIDAALVEDALVGRGFLAREDADDPEKVATALREAVQQYIAAPPEPEDAALPVTAAISRVW